MHAAEGKGPSRWRGPAAREGRRNEAEALVNAGRDEWELPALFVRGDLSAEAPVCISGIHLSLGSLQDRALIGDKEDEVSGH